jgi:5-methylcytosine-specific restriction enzyme subunit McrC
MFLVYPSHQAFKQPIPHSFDFPIQASTTLKLWVVPFVINDDEKGIQWSDEAKTPTEFY